MATSDTNDILPLVLEANIIKLIVEIAVLILGTYVAWTLVSTMITGVPQIIFYVGIVLIDIAAVFTIIRPLFRR